MPNKEVNYPAQIKALKAEIEDCKIMISARSKRIEQLVKEVKDARDSFSELGSDFHDVFNSVGDLTYRMMRVVKRYGISSETIIRR